MTSMFRLAPIVALLASPMVAQSAETTSFTSRGTGAAIAKPDIAFVDLGFQSRGETPQETVEADTLVVGKVTAALGSAGVAAHDIQTATYVIEQVMGPQGCGQTYGDQPFVPCEPDGFEIRNSITIRVRDLANYGNILGAAIEAGLSDISRITLAVSDPEPYRQRAYADALLAARAKAELTAQTLGLELGAILDVGANFQHSYDETEPATLRDGQAMDYPDGQADLGVIMQIQPGELTFSEQASITYEIVQKR